MDPIIKFLFTTRLFASLGEGWRYLTFTFSLVHPIMVTKYVIELGFTLEIILYFVILGINLFRSLLKKIEKNNNHEIFDILEKSNIPKSKRILYCIPNRIGTGAVVMGYANKTTEVQLGNADTEYLNKYFAILPNILNTSEGWIKKAKINLVLIQKNYYKRWEENASAYFKKNMKKIAETEHFILYSFN